QPSTLSLHDALPISATAGTTNALLEAAESARSGHASRWRATLDAIRDRHLRLARAVAAGLVRATREIPSNPSGIRLRLQTVARRDRKSTRLNSSHVS